MLQGDTPRHLVTGLALIITLHESPCRERLRHAPAYCKGPSPLHISERCDSANNHTGDRKTRRAKGRTALRLHSLRVRRFRDRTAQRSGRYKHWLATHTTKATKRASEGTVKPSQSAPPRSPYRIERYHGRNNTETQEQVIWEEQRHTDVRVRRIEPG